MLNSSLLADAIADAKAVRATALANAKQAMIDAFRDKSKIDEIIFRFDGSNTQGTKHHIKSFFNVLSKDDKAKLKTGQIFDMYDSEEDRTLECQVTNVSDDYVQGQYRVTFEIKILRQI